MRSHIKEKENFCVIGVTVEQATQSSTELKSFDELLIVTNDLVRQINPEDEEMEHLSWQATSQSSQKLRQSHSELRTPFLCDKFYFLNLSGHVFSAFSYLLTMNDVFRKSFLVNQIVKQKPLSTFTAFIQIGLFMPHNMQIGFKRYVH